MNSLLGKSQVSSSNGRGRRHGAILLALGLALAGPGLVSQANAAPAPPARDLTDTEVNRSLDMLAKRLAAAAGNADLRMTIHRAVGKRFDGDENALWRSLSANPAFSSSVAGTNQSRNAIAGAAAQMPRLQIAVPVHFDSWDPATYAPLVAYLPQGVDDTELTTVTAYDTKGNTVSLDAQVQPEQPVIVLGLNERTDEQGDLLESPDTSPQTTDLAEYSVTAAATTAYSVDMRMVHLIDDKEPWVAGDAEISMKARSRGCSGTEYINTNWENLNHSGDWWAPGGTRNLGLTRCDVVFYWWEDDGGSADFTLAYGGFSLGVKMDNDDDLIGGKQVPYASFRGGGTDTWRKDEWSALAQWTE